MRLTRTQLQRRRGPVYGSAYAGCVTPCRSAQDGGGMLVALVGQPNSGKSAILARLTGARVVTSNYPGTTVEIVQGRMRQPQGDAASARRSKAPRQSLRPPQNDATRTDVSEGPRQSLRTPHDDVIIVDTPGIYSMAALTREQETTRDLLEKGLPEIAPSGRPGRKSRHHGDGPGSVSPNATLVSRRPDLIVNVVDGTNLARHLSLTLSLLDLGLPLLVAVNCADRMRELGLRLDAARLAELLGVKVLLVSALTGEGMGDLAREILVRSSDSAVGNSGGDTKKEHEGMESSAATGDVRELQRRATALAEEAISSGCLPEWSQLHSSNRHGGLFEHAENALDKPLISVIVLGISLIVIWRVIAWSLPAAESVIRTLLEPVGTYLERFLSFALPKSALSPLIAGALTEGLVLPLAVVLPAMIISYVLIALLEDTGLLARYAAMGDILTGLLNLPGQALIPFMLGFGCRVPGLLSARILPSEESRRSASIIIATVVPCTATVSMAWTALAKFGGNPIVPVVALITSTWLLARLMKFSTGKSKDPLVLELPPLRLPSFGNIAMKTQMRLSGFFTHVLPLVIGMNVVIRLVVAGTGGGLGQALSEFARGVLGIPPEAFAGVLLTMLQRYLAPLFILQQNLTAREATIAITMIVLGFPCLPSAVTLWREHGPGAVLESFVASMCLFLGWGVLLNLVLPR